MSSRDRDPREVRAIHGHLIPGEPAPVRTPAEDRIRRLLMLADHATPDEIADEVERVTLELARAVFGSAATLAELRMISEKADNPVTRRAMHWAIDAVLHPGDAASTDGPPTCRRCGHPAHEHLEIRTADGAPTRYIPCRACGCTLAVDP